MIIALQHSFDYKSEIEKDCIVRNDLAKYTTCASKTFVVLKSTLDTHKAKFQQERIISIAKMKMPDSDMTQR